MMMRIIKYYLGFNTAQQEEEKRFLENRDIESDIQKTKNFEKKVDKQIENQWNKTNINLDRDLIRIENFLSVFYFPEELIIFIASILEIQDLINFCQTCRGANIIILHSPLHHDLKNNFHRSHQTTYAEMISAFRKRIILEDDIETLEKQIEKYTSKPSVYFQAAHYSLTLSLMVFFSGGITFLFGEIFYPKWAAQAKELGDAYTDFAKTCKNDPNFCPQNTSYEFFAHRASERYAEESQFEAKAKLEYDVGLSMLCSSIPCFFTSIGFFYKSHSVSKQNKANEVDLNKKKSAKHEIENKFPRFMHEEIRLPRKALK